MSGGPVFARGSGARRASGGGFGKLFPQLFLFPLLLVTVAVLVYLLFVASARDSRSIDDLLRDIQSGGGHSRKQDAWALAQKVSEVDTRGGDGYITEEQTRQLLRLLDQAIEDDDDEMRSFLVFAFGRLGQPELTWPRLKGILDDPATSSEVRKNVILGLSLSRNRAAVPTLLHEVRSRTDPGEWETRWIATHAVVNILTHGEALPADRLANDPLVEMAVRGLRPMVGNSRKEVSWNTSVWLAKYFRDDQGESVLRDLVSWEFLDAQRGERNQELTEGEKAAFMALAIEGLYALHGADLRALLEEKKNDRSLPVRNVALTCLGELNGPGKPERRA